MPVGNLLLGALSARDQSLLESHAGRIDIIRGDVVFRAGDDVSTVTFPLDHTIITLLVGLKEGKSVEVATIGREGAVGGVVSRGFLPAFTQAVVQVGGPALRIDTAHLQRAKRSSPALADLFIRYGDCLLAQVFQSVACNAVHSIDQRCLRWLLTLRDRLGMPWLPVTHEMLAEMLGVRRSYLTSVVGDLQRSGLIEAKRGVIRLKDHQRVEDAACECYASVRRHYETVLGTVHDARGTLVSLDASSQNVRKDPCTPALAEFLK